MRFSFLLVVASLAIAAENTPVAVIEEIIAKVNGDIVTRSEIDRSRARIQAELQAQGVTGPAAAEAVALREKNLLRDRIDQLLLIQKGNELSISVDAEVTRQIARIQEDAVKRDPELIDIDKFQAYVRAQTGLSIEDYKLEMKNGMVTQRVIRQEVGRLVNIPRTEMREYYDKHQDEFQRDERVFLREIYLSTKDLTGAELEAVEKKAADLVARSRKGEKFPELAQAHSQSASAQNYGDIGSAKRDDLKKEIADLVFENGRGYVTDPIKLPEGLLILKVEEKHKAGLASFEEVENEITEKLYSSRFEPKIREYLTQLRQDAFLEIKEGYVDASAAPGKNTKWTDPAELKPETVSKEEVAAAPRRRRLLWTIPIPGTKTSAKSTSK